MTHSSITETLSVHFVLTSKLSLSLSPVSPEALARLLNLLESGFISSSAAKAVSLCSFEMGSCKSDAMIYQPLYIYTCTPLVGSSIVHRNGLHLSVAVPVLSPFSCSGLKVACHVAQVFQEMWKAPEKRVEQLVKDLDLGLISDRKELVRICQRVMDARPDLVRLTWIGHFLAQCCHGYPPETFRNNKPHLAAKIKCPGLHNTLENPENIYYITATSPKCQRVWCNVLFHGTKSGGGVSVLQVLLVRGGNKKVLNKLMGAVQKESKGRADPLQIRNILEEMTSWLRLV